jgi:hypothetical protein
VTRTRTWPAPTSGTGTSRRLRASGPPNDSTNWTARADPVAALVGVLMLIQLLENLRTAKRTMLRFN